MLNATFVLLTLQRTSNSPLFSTSISSFSRFVSFDRCFFSNFANNILYSHSASNYLISSTNFFHGLSQAIYLAESKRINQPKSRIHCFKCVFSNINSPQQEGGAINSNHRVTLESCIIKDVSCGSSGAIFCVADVIIIRCYFKKITANTLGLLSVGSGCSLVINNSILVEITTHFGPSFKRHGGTQTDLSGSNFTHFTTSIYLPIGEFGQCRPIIKNCVFRDTNANEKNGALSFWQCDDFVCEYSLFMRISVSKASSINGIAIWLDGSLQTGRIDQCAFFKCSSEKGHVIFAAEINRVTVEKCSFDKPKDISLNVHAKLIDMDSKYSLSLNDLPKHWEKNVIEVPVEIDAIPKIFDIRVIFYISSVISLVFMLFLMVKFS